MHSLHTPSDIFAEDPQVLVIQLATLSPTVTLSAHFCRPLVSKELPIETKAFYFEIGENTRGRFLRVSESGAG